MALTEEEKSKVVLALGYPAFANFRFITSLELDNPVYEEQILKDLATIDRVQTALQAIEETVEANALGEIELSYSRKIKFLKSQGNHAILSLSRLLDIPVFFNRFNTRARDSTIALGYINHI